MAVTDWSTSAAGNVSISGTNIAEGCPAGNLNNAFRQMMADVRVMYNNLPVTGDLLKKDGTVQLTGQLSFAGRGAHLHHNSSANSSGRIFVQAAGGATPSMSDGDILIEF